MTVLEIGRFMLCQPVLVSAEAAIHPDRPAQHCTDFKEPSAPQPKKGFKRVTWCRRVSYSIEIYVHNMKFSSVQSHKQPQ